MVQERKSTHVYRSTFLILHTSSDLTVYSIWVVKPHGFVRRCQRFGKTCYLQLQKPRKERHLHRRDVKPHIILHACILETNILHCYNQTADIKIRQAVSEVKHADGHYSLSCVHSIQRTFFKKQTL